MFKLFKFAFYVIVALVLFMLNPKKEQHEKAIQEQTAKDNTVAALLGAGWIKSKMVSYNDYYVCSVTKYGDTFVSFGIANYVWVGNVDTSELKKLKDKIEDKLDG
ncbi:hypothetical protein EP331_06540 [bacterium]|nr:MAG: hypothetical protein EP331_06540 [bacterium]